MEINLKNSKIFIENNIIDKIADFVSAKNIFVVTDENVFLLYFRKTCERLEKAGCKVSCHVLKPGEASKSIENLNILYGECIKNNITRSDLIIALGGGVVGDITGFLASTYLRGVPLMQIPTTFLAQIDSSVGGKTAVNLEFGKNLAGTFYQPHVVLIDPVLLKSLSSTVFADGIAEAVKYAFIKDRDLLKFFDDFSKNILEIIERCVIIKKNVVFEDEFDKGERMLLNFGHTVGHAIEKTGNYSLFTHGQAISIGMVAAAEISRNLGFVEDETVKSLRSLLVKNGLPVDCGFMPEICLQYVTNDKKLESSTINAILIKGVGDSFIQKFDVNEFIELAGQTKIFI